MTTSEKLEKSFEITDQEQNVLRHIGWYYHNTCENLDEAFKQLKNLCIHKVFIENKIIYICLERPRLFIGERGSNISAIEKYLSENGFEGYQFRIIEVRYPPMDYLTSWQYAYMDIDEI